MAVVHSKMRENVENLIGMSGSSSFLIHGVETGQALWDYHLIFKFL